MAETRQATLIDQEPAPQSQALVVRSDADAFVEMCERLATNPDVDVTKLEKILEMQMRIVAHRAKAEFDAAFADMQGELPVISELGEIKVGETVRSKYAKYEDIHDAIRPVLKKHGFAIRHRHETATGKIKTIAILSHRSGHSEQDEFETAADSSVGKNDIQAIGSARSYGQRYTTISIVGLSTRDPRDLRDDDGQAAGRLTKKVPDTPAGYDDWLLNLKQVAESDGTARLTDAWKNSRDDYRRHLIATNTAQWETIKVTAAKTSKQHAEAARA